MNEKMTGESPIVETDAGLYALRLVIEAGTCLEPEIGSVLDQFNPDEILRLDMLESEAYRKEVAKMSPEQQDALSAISTESPKYADVLRQHMDSCGSRCFWIGRYRNRLALLDARTA